MDTHIFLNEDLPNLPIIDLRVGDVKYYSEVPTQIH